MFLTVKNQINHLKKIIFWNCFRLKTLGASMMPFVLFPVQKSSYFWIINFRAVLLDFPVVSRPFLLESEADYSAGDFFKLEFSGVFGGLDFQFILNAFKEFFFLMLNRNNISPIISGSENNLKIVFGLIDKVKVRVALAVVIKMFFAIPQPVKNNCLLF